MDRRRAVGGGMAVLAALAAVGACGDEPTRTSAGSSEGSATGPTASCDHDVVLVASTYGEWEEGGDVVGLTTDGEVRRLTEDGGSFGPSLSPDGSELAVASVGPGGEVSDSLGPYKLDIVVMGVDGSDRRTVVDGLDARQPDWSPDGEHIAYVERGDDVTELPDRIHVVAADGTGDRELVAHDGPEDDADPAWSPDGRRLAFVRSDVEGRSQMVVASSDGTGAEVVHEAAGRIGAPTWSPDGARLAFPEHGTGQRDAVTVLTPATGEVVEEPGPVEGLAWAANGLLYGFARPPAVDDFTGEWRVVELAPDGDGFDRARAIAAVPPEGFLYTDYSVDVPPCTGPDAPPLTREADRPEALVVTNPHTGEEVAVMPREAAEAKAREGREGARSDGSLLVVGEEATWAALAEAAPMPSGGDAVDDPAGRTGPSVEELTIPEGALCWLVLVDGGLTIIDATTGEQTSAGGGGGDRLPDLPDLAP